MMKTIVLLMFFLTPFAGFSQEGIPHCRKEGSSLIDKNVKTFIQDGTNKNVLAMAANNKGPDLNDEIKNLCKKAMDQKDEYRDGLHETLRSYITNKKIKNLSTAYFDFKCRGKRLDQVILDTSGNPGLVRDLYEEFSLPVQDPRGIVKSTALDSLCVFFSSARLLQRPGLPNGQNCRILIEKDKDGKATHPNMNQEWLEAVEFFIENKAKRGCEMKKPKTCSCAKEENGKYFVCRNKSL